MDRDASDEGGEQSDIFIPGFGESRRQLLTSQNGESKVQSYQLLN